jgi:serine/threonine protein kinase
MDKRKPVEEPEIPQMKNFKILKLIQKSRFSVYLVESVPDKVISVMKVFPSVEMGVSPSFMNESRYKEFSHPHVIKLLYVNPKESFTFKKKQEYGSYILMEYAIHGTLRNLMMKVKIQDDETLTRTFFRQITFGLEYLHNQKIAHMDLKLENILIGEDYKLKVADFDTAAMLSDVFVLGRGTTNYRAPELKNKKCKKIKLADMFSLGIILFTLRHGVLPYAEDILVNKFNLMDFLFHSYDDFWKAHQVLSDGVVQYEDDFAQLFHGLTRFKPEARMTFEDIKNNSWWNGPVYEQERVEEILKDAFKVK